MSTGLYGAPKAAHRARRTDRTGAVVAVGQTGAELTPGLSVITAKLDIGTRTTALSWIENSAAPDDAAGLTDVTLVGVARTVVRADLGLQTITVTSTRSTDGTTSRAAALIALALGLPSGGVVAGLKHIAVAASLTFTAATAAAHARAFTATAFTGLAIKPGALIWSAGFDIVAAAAQRAALTRRLETLTFAATVIAGSSIAPTA